MSVKVKILENEPIVYLTTFVELLPCYKTLFQVLRFETKEEDEIIAFKEVKKRESTNST